MRIASLPKNIPHDEGSDDYLDKNSAYGDVRTLYNISYTKIDAISVSADFTADIKLVLDQEDLDGRRVFALGSGGSADEMLHQFKLADTTKWTLSAEVVDSQQGIYGIINKPEVLDVNKVWSAASSNKSDLTLTISLGSEQMADGLTAQLLSEDEVVYSKNITGTYPASSQISLSLSGVSTESTYTLKILARNSNISGTYFEVYSLESVEYVDPSGVPTITTQPVSATYGQGDTPTALSVVAAIPSGHSGTLSYKWYSSSTKNVPTSGDPIGTNSSYTPVVTTPGALYYKVVVTFTDSSSGTSKTVESVVVQVSVNYAIRYFDADGYRMAGMTNTEYDGKSNVDLDPIPKEYQKDGCESYWTDSVSGSRITTLYPGNTGDVSVRLTYSVITYSIAYNTYMGTNADSNPVTYTVLDSIQFEDPVKDGNLFGGWYLDSSFTTKVTSNSGLHENLTLYAKWTPLTYTLSLNPEGGIIDGEESSEVKNISMSGTSSYTLPSVTLDNKYLIGWNTDDGGEGTTYSPGTTLKNLTTTNKDTVTLYAIWATAQNTYKITLDPNGRSWKSGYTGGNVVDFVYPNPSETKYYYDTSLPSVAESMDYEGYTFVGWYSLPVGGTKVWDGSTTGIEITLTKSTILYAHWTSISYTITYNLNSGTQNGKNLASYNIESPTVNFYDPTRTNFLFKGWYTESTFVNQITEIPAGSTGAKTLYAKWESPISYTIAFNVSGGSSVSNISAKAGVAYTAPTTIKSGSTFNGWNTASDGSGTTYGAGASLKDLTTTSSATVTLYAQWTATPKYIMYELSGGQLPSDAPKTYAADAVTLKNPTREGYIFLGWLGSGISGITYEVTISAGSNGDREFIAMWKAKPYAITFTEEAGSYSVSLDYGSTILLPSVQKVDGKDFTGWYTSNGTFAGYDGWYYTVAGQDTLSARYVTTSGVMYVITVSKGSAGSTEDYTVYVAVGESMILPVASEISGYEFSGWYTADTRGTFTTLVGIPGQYYTPSSDIYLNPKYVAKLTITFKGIDGSADLNNAVMTASEGEVVQLPNYNAAEGYHFLGWTTTADTDTLVGTYGTRYTMGATSVTLQAKVASDIPAYAVSFGKWYEGTPGSATVQTPDNAPFTLVYPTKIIGNSYGLLTIEKTTYGYGLSITAIRAVAAGGTDASDDKATLVQMDDTHWMISSVIAACDILVYYEDSTGFGHSDFAITGFVGQASGYNNGVRVQLNASSEAGLEGGTVSLHGTKYRVENGTMIFSAIDSTNSTVVSPDTAAVTEGSMQYTAVFKLNDTTHRIYYAYAEYEYSGQYEDSAGILGVMTNRMLE